MLGRKHAADHHSVGGRSAHLQSFGGFLERDLAALSAFAVAINRNAVIIPKAADMGARPGGVMRRRLSRAVQDGSDCVIRQLPREHANQIGDTGFDCPSGMLKAPLIPVGSRSTKKNPRNGADFTKRLERARLTFG